MSPVTSSQPQNPAQLSYAPGQVIAGKYALEAMLGSGGMGAVFRARNTAIDMPVAIKLIRADLDRDQLSGRLLQEARAAAKLAHPSIVRVFDVGTTALGDPFIVMELLAGESLAAVLKRETRLSSARAVQLLLPIVDALSVAHTKGFVHRDVKPDNVFIVNDEDGQVQPKLFDFGIVKHEQPSADGQVTQVGSVLGSPDYMSPEQARGLEQLDLRSDVWSFSVMLYETICGEMPFVSPNYNALLRMIVEEEPQSLRARNAADAELSAIVSKGMSKDPNGRWPSMGQYGRALATWLLGQGIGEDARGVALETRWLARSTDPAPPGRVYPSPVPDGWPEPPSGVRVVRGGLGYAPTMEVAPSAGTPVPASSGNGRAFAERRRGYWLVAGGGAAAAVALALSLSGARRAAPPDAPAATRQGAAPSNEARPEPRSTAVAVAAAATVTPPPAAPSAQGLEPDARPRPQKPTLRPSGAAVAGAVRRKPAAEPQPAKPASDLLSPY